MHPRKILLAAILILSNGCAAKKISPSRIPDDAFTPQVIASATVAAMGDIMMHGAVKKSATEYGGYTDLFSDVAWEIKGADIAFSNLETPIAPKSDQGSRPFVFNAPLSLLHALKDLGMDVLSFANNHVYDQGRPGFAETLTHLNDLGFYTVGAGTSQPAAVEPLVLNVRGIRTAFLGYSDVFNSNLNVSDPQQPVANEFVLSIATTAVAAARSAADFVVVSIHWGVEYKENPTDGHKAAARALFDSGADVILGHHPHVLQPLEVFKSSGGRVGFVAYSLGNFVSNQSRFYVHAVSSDTIGDTRDSVILHFTVDKKDYGQGIVRTELGRIYYAPIWTENDTLTATGRPARIRVVSIDRARERIKKEMAHLLQSSAELAAQPMSSARYVELSQQLSLLNKRRQIIINRLGDGFAVAETSLQEIPPKPSPKRVKN